MTVRVARASDRWVSITLSVLLHGALLAALVYGWVLFRRPPPPRPTLAIEATVVDARAVKGAVRPPPPLPPPPAEAPEEVSGPPPPTPEELAQREQQRQQAQAAVEEQRRAAEEKAAAETARAKQAEERRRVEEQRQAEARAAAERKARAAAEAQKRAAEQQQRLADAQAQSELQRSLAAEEHANVTRSSAALANYQALIAAKITRAWLRPPTARPGLECMLYVTQVSGGDVTKVTIGQCNGDQAVRESIEAAVYRASPLPPPPDPSLFDPHLRIDFKPD